MSASVSISLALTMAGTTKPLPRKNSTRTPLNGISNLESTREREFSIYKGISDRPLGWKPRRAARATATGQMARETIRKWDGTARKSTEWDGLRRDPELWLANGNCLVHLYSYGQSRRGPAFRVSLEVLRAANCQPLLDRFLVEVEESTPSSLSSSNSRTSYFDHPARKYDLYIPAPTDIERGQASLYHAATRNFFAWIFGKSLVGNHLGGALVGLLNSMNEFRSQGEDNVQAIMDFMDEEGYGDMRNQPDHALGILFFAEHFRFWDLWIDAFAHCCGMHEKLTSSLGFEFISRSSRAMITRSRLEMDMRLDACGRRLGIFLSDDLSYFHLGLSAGALAHLDNFRSFLQSYFVAKLGYYPPTSSSAQNAAFPKHVFGQMCAEFEKLYDFLVDDTSTTSSQIPIAHSEGICVQQVVERFDRRHKHEGLLYTLPRLPEIEEPVKPQLKKRFSILPKTDKMVPDPRLVVYAALSKATNCREKALLDCSLVRAYRGFEKECVFSPSKLEKNENLSQIEARKVRWILIYTIVQTLLSATKIPEQVTDTRNVPYNLCVLTAGCPPWTEERPYETLLRTQTEQTKADFQTISNSEKATLPNPVKPDVDHFASINNEAPHSRESSDATLRPGLLQGTMNSALNSVESMPALVHPKPHRASYHEIVVQGYGNGTNMINITTGAEQESPSTSGHSRKSSGSSSSMEDSSFRWSNSSIDPIETDSPHTSVASHSRRGSESSVATEKYDIEAYLDGPDDTVLDLERVPSSIYCDAVDEGTCWEPEGLEVEPLQITKIPERSPKRERPQEEGDEDVLFMKPKGKGKGKAVEGRDQKEGLFMKVTNELKVKWNGRSQPKAEGDVFEYLHNPNPCPMVVVQP